MSPTFGDDEALRAILLQAKAVNKSERSTRADKLAEVEPLIKALERSLRKREDCRELARDLIATLKLVPIYATDPTMGADPIAHRWIVYRNPEFHRCIERLRAEFPLVQEFKS